MSKKLIPYTVYLPEDQYNKLKKYAKERKASSVIRDAISSFLSGGDLYLTGYNKGLQDASKAVSEVAEVKMLSIHGDPLCGILKIKLEEMEQ
jgi:hypothetical protein